MTTIHFASSTTHAERNEENNVSSHNGGRLYALRSVVRVVCSVANTLSCESFAITIVCLSISISSGP